MKNFLIILTLLSLVFTGCGTKEKNKKVYTLSDAQKKLVESVKEKHGYDIVVQQTENTLWVYAPIEQSIVEIKATAKKGNKHVEKMTQGLHVYHVEGSFQPSGIQLEYDIDQSKSYPKDFGYTSTASEDFQKRQRNLMNAIQAAYYNVEENEETVLSDSGETEFTITTRDVEANDLTPEFIVLVITNIKSGLEIKSTFYFEDLKRAMSLIPSLTGDEFAKRYISETRGNEEAIGNKEGTHLSYHAIEFKDFFVQQIQKRIEQKYAQSRNKPSENSRQEILNIIAKTMQSYQFYDIPQITFLDLNTNTQETVTKEELMKIIEENPVQEKKNRLLNIKFNGKNFGN